MSADPIDGGPAEPRAVATSIRDELTRLDGGFESWHSRHGIPVLGYALAAVFSWFGIVKPLGISPANPVVYHGVSFLPFELFFPVLGWWEATVGVGLLFERTVRIAVHPLVAFPGETFTHFPYTPSFEGVYIVKDWVLVGDAMAVGGRLDGATD